MMIEGVSRLIPRVVRHWPKIPRGVVCCLWLRQVRHAFPPSR